ncbi:unnamed protein product, partial [Amoebophrya sp. A120]
CEKKKEQHQQEPGTAEEQERVGKQLNEQSSTSNKLQPSQSVPGRCSTSKVEKTGTTCSEQNLLYKSSSSGPLVPIYPGQEQLQEKFLNLKATIEALQEETGSYWQRKLAGSKIGADAQKDEEI